MGSFVTREPAEATRTIMRTDMQRTMLVQADLEKGVLIEPVLDQVRAAVPVLDFDPSVKLRFKGGARTRRNGRLLGKAFLVGLDNCLILVAEFNSLFQRCWCSPLWCSPQRCCWACWSRPPSLWCGIGTIALAGIIVNNNIVLIDTCNSCARLAWPRRKRLHRRAASAANC
jgi:multidrug efflux pump